MVGLQVDGPLGVVLGSSQGLGGRSWAALRAYVGGPGPLSGPLWAVLGRLGAFVGGPRLSWVRSWVPCWRSWAALGVNVGRSWAACWRSWGVCWRSWRILRPLLAVLRRHALKKVEERDHLENLLISRVGARSAAWRAVLSRSWGLCWRSWGALGAYVGDLGPLLESKLAVWACLGA